MNDIDALLKEGNAPSELESLLSIARRAVELQAQSEALEAELRAVNSALHNLKTKELPDAMAAAGLSSFGTPEGASIKIDDFVSGTLPKEDAARARALRLLEDEGGAALIKDELSIAFDKKEHNAAVDVAERLRGEGWPVILKQGVHPQTLMAFVREKLRNGEDIDYEALGCFVGRKAKIELPE